MATRRTELRREAARLFAERGYHGTSIGDLAEALGVQKATLYAYIESKQDLLYETMREGADAFHGALDAIPEQLPPVEKIQLALRGHLRVVAEQLDVATVFVQEWRISLPDLLPRLESARTSAESKGWRWIGEMEEIADAFAAHELPDGFHRAAAEVYRWPQGVRS